MSDILTVRIVRDQNNQDGWIARDLGTNKVCFISNLNLIIHEISAGSLYEAQVIESKEKHNIVELANRIRA